MKDDEKKFEQAVLRLIRRGKTPFVAYIEIELKHRRKYGTRRYFNYESYVRSTRIKINTLKLVKCTTPQD